MQATFKRKINNILDNGHVPIKAYKRKNYFDLGSDMKKKLIEPLSTSLHQMQLLINNSRSMESVLIISNSSKYHQII